VSSLGQALKNVPNFDTGVDFWGVFKAEGEKRPEQRRTMLGIG